MEEVSSILELVKTNDIRTWVCYWIIISLCFVLVYNLYKFVINVHVYFTDTLGCNARQTKRNKLCVLRLIVTNLIMVAITISGGYYLYDKAEDLSNESCTIVTRFMDKYNKDNHIELDLDNKILLVYQVEQIENISKECRQ